MCSRAWSSTSPKSGAPTAHRARSPLRHSCAPPPVIPAQAGIQPHTQAPVIPAPARHSCAPPSFLRRQESSLARKRAQTLADFEQGLGGPSPLREPPPYAGGLSASSGLGGRRGAVSTVETPPPPLEASLLLAAAAFGAGGRPTPRPRSAGTSRTCRADRVERDGYHGHRCRIARARAASLPHQPNTTIRRASRRLGFQLDGLVVNLSQIWRTDG